MKIQYEEWRPSRRALELVAIANVICAEMAAQGYDLTLRQLYYQFVARAVIENTERSYKNLGVTISRARTAGLLDWSYIEDRTRYLRGLPHASGPEDIIREAARRLNIDKWQDQDNRVEIWVEKEALVSVVERPAVAWDVNFFACKGYVSQSELHAAALRHQRYERDGQTVTVIHLGDHDPSGIDMTRDVRDRLWTFGAATDVRRIALNMDQIEAHDPPPNPAKLSDSRASDYVARYGRSSWELDALSPAIIDRLIQDTIAEYVTDDDAFQHRQTEQEDGRASIQQAARHWGAVTGLLERLTP